MTVSDRVVKRLTTLASYDLRRARALMVIVPLLIAGVTILIVWRFDRELAFVAGLLALAASRFSLVSALDRSLNATADRLAAFVDAELEFRPADETRPADSRAIASNSSPSTSRTPERGS